jgi:hypothetical protein
VTSSLASDLLQELFQPANLLVALQPHGIPLDQRFGPEGLFVKPDRRGVPLRVKHPSASVTYYTVYSSFGESQGIEKPMSMLMLTLRTHHSILPQSFSLAIRPRCPKRTFPIPAARRLGVTYRSSSYRIDIHRMQGEVSEYCGGGNRIEQVF